MSPDADGLTHSRVCREHTSMNADICSGVLAKCGLGPTSRRRAWQR